MKLMLPIVFSIISILFVDAVPLDITGIMDKYGFPTAALILTCGFIWNRQKRSDTERNGLITQNNILTQQLIDEVKKGNQCRFEK